MPVSTVNCRCLPEAMSRKKRIGWLRFRDVLIRPDMS